MELVGFNGKFGRNFIALYKSFPCIWDMKAPSYNDKYAKQRAYNKLALLMRQVNPDANISVVKKKINSIRTTYRREKRKLLEKRKNGDIHYKPSLWYYDLMHFLVGEDEKTETTRNDATDDDNDCYDVTLEEDELRDIVTEDVKPDPLNLFNEEEEDEAREESPTPINKKTLTHGNGKRTSKINITDSNESDTNAMGNVNEATSSIYGILNRLENRNRESNDVSTVFGKYVAMELSKMEDQTANFCRKIISEAIFEAQMGKLNYFSKIVTPEQ